MTNAQPVSTPPADVRSGAASNSITAPTCMWQVPSSMPRKEASIALSRS